MKEKITHKKLKEFLNYNKVTGNFRWKVSGNGRLRNKIAGSNQGYIYITLMYKSYLAHRLAWLYVYGYFPENDIDHIDGNKDNNRISNLREASKQCNARNCKLRGTNNSGITGVCSVKKGTKWQAYVKVDGKQIYLGEFKEFFDAVMARWKGEKKYNYGNCCTSSSAYNYLINDRLIN